VRSDLIMHYELRNANEFPSEGYDVSGAVTDDFYRVEFDVVLSSAVAV